MSPRKKQGPWAKKELAVRANQLYVDHGGTDNLVHAKWYVATVSAVLKRLYGKDIYTAKK